MLTESVTVPATAGDEPSDPVSSNAVHRLRDLDRRGRLVAALFALAVILAPLFAFFWATPDWAPSNDPALMALRSLDVGTSRTPVSGQPSTSGSQVEDEDEELLVTHPGPIHFYVMAVPVRLLGAALGMVLVSVLITGVCVLVAAWATFRQLGPPGGMLAAVALGLIMFTTGAATLVNPVSSNIARYPMLCSMVLLWCLLCGDRRLLPLTVGVVSFAAQQHLSVLPAMALAILLSAGIVIWTRRRDWRETAIWPPYRTMVGLAAIVALVMWFPVILQELFGDVGNLSAMITFGQAETRQSVGFSSAVQQIARAAGWPLLLGQQDLTGTWLLQRPTAVGWTMAALVLALTGVLGWSWRRTEPKRAWMAVMVGILLVAGLINGSQVPDTLEQQRLALYHWTWPFTFFLVLILGLGLYGLVERHLAGRVPALRPALVGLAALAVVLPAVINPSLDRLPNRLSAAYSPVTHGDYRSLADQILEHRDELGTTMVVERSADPVSHLIRGLGSGLSVELIERDVDVRFSPWIRQATHEDRLISRRTIDSALVLVTDEEQKPFTDDVPGELVATVERSPVDDEALDELVEAVEDADEVVFGPELQDYLAAQSQDRSYMLGAAVASIGDDPRNILLTRGYVELLRKYPLAEPELDPELLDQLAESLPKPGSFNATLRVYLLDRDTALEYLGPFEFGFKDKNGNGNDDD